MNERQQNISNKKAKIRLLPIKSNVQNKKNKEISSIENNKYKIIHNNKLNEIDRLLKDLNYIEAENNSLSLEIEKLKEKENSILENFNRINNDYVKEKNELNEMKNINKIKNETYIKLLHLRIQQQLSNSLNSLLYPDNDSNINDSADNSNNNINQ